MCDKSGNKLSDTRFFEAKTKVHNGDFASEVTRNYSNAENVDYSLIPLKTITGKYCYIDQKGNTVIDAKYDAANLFSEDMAVIGINNGTEDEPSFKFGYINKKGEQIINPQFDMAGDFCEGYALVGMKNNKSEDDYAKLYGFIDKTGKYAIDTQYDFYGENHIKNGIAIVGKYIKAEDTDDEDTIKYGAISMSNDVILNFDYDDLSFGYNSNIIEYSKDDNYGFLDYSGNKLFDKEYKAATYFYSDGYAVVSTDDKKFTVIDTDGNKLWEKEYEGIGNKRGYEFCKYKDCYNPVSFSSEKSYCHAHEEEFEEKSSEKESEKKSSSVTASIIGDWKNGIGSIELNCYSSGTAFFTVLDELYMGSWESITDRFYSLNIKGLSGYALVEDDILTMSLAGADALILFKQ